MESLATTLSTSSNPIQSLPRSTHPAMTLSSLCSPRPGTPPSRGRSSCTLHPPWSPRSEDPSVCFLASPSSLSGMAPSRRTSILAFSSPFCQTQLPNIRSIKNQEHFLHNVCTQFWTSVLFLCLTSHSINPRLHSCTVKRCNIFNIGLYCVPLIMYDIKGKSQLSF